MSFNRACLGPVGFAQVRMMLPVVARGVSGVVPEIRALGAGTLASEGEIAGLAHDLASDSVPLFLELSPAHREALAEVVVHLKRDLDEIKDSIQDMEPDFTELLKFLRQE